MVLTCIIEVEMRKFYGHLKKKMHIGQLMCSVSQKYWYDLGVEDHVCLKIQTKNENKR